MVDYNPGARIYLDEESKLAERSFRTCFCPSRDLGHSMHHGHLTNMFIGEKIGRWRHVVAWQLLRKEMPGCFYNEFIAYNYHVHYVFTLSVCWCVCLSICVGVCLYVLLCTSCLENYSRLAGHQRFIFDCLSVCVFVVCLWWHFVLVGNSKFIL